jgi:hypothetical protein
MTCLHLTLLVCTHLQAHAGVWGVVCVCVGGGGGWPGGGLVGEIHGRGGGVDCKLLQLGLQLWSIQASTPHK